MIKKSQSERGQISIMVGMMMMTFLFFFAFVINTGMLVNAKINLQNAADLAAYAGAAVQARQLTQISYLNYEMRRQWKKLLYRLYVVGNMSQDWFQQNDGSAGPMQYRPNTSGSSNVDYQLPTTCIIFNPNENYCHITELPAITIPPSSPLDSITSTLITQLQSIENIRQMNCKTIGQTNILLNMYWLFNADPNLIALTNNTSSLSPDQIKVLTIIAGYSHGLGIVPREVILRFRIRTLAGYVNTPAQQNVTLEKAQKFSQGMDPAATERVQQAFFSAYYTLGNHTFPGSSVLLDELLPGNSTQAQLLGLKDIKEKIDSYAINFTLNGQSNGNPSATPTACKAEIVPISLAQPIPLGVFKDPSILTYYAIRLTAKVNILFSPFGQMEMKAYSAAMPFGSRIGPTPEQGAVFSTRSGGSTSMNAQGGQNLNSLPNLPLEEQETTARGQGWDRIEVLSTMYHFLINPTGQGISSSITTADMERAYQPAMAPNPYEGKLYNIINDEGPDSFIKNFGTDGYAAFWAPVFPPDQISQSMTLIQSEINAMFDDSTQGYLGAGQNAISNVQSDLAQGLQNYISKDLVAGTGEDGEGVNVVRIFNPFKEKMASGQIAPTSASNPKYFMTSPAQFKTSWNRPTDNKFRQEGRVGYSVKFVAFEALQKKFSTNGSNTFNNDLPPDSELDIDLPFIKH